MGGLPLLPSGGRRPVAAHQRPPRHPRAARGQRGRRVAAPRRGAQRGGPGGQEGAGHPLEVWAVGAEWTGDCVRLPCAVAQIYSWERWGTGLWKMASHRTG